MAQPRVTRRSGATKGLSVVLPRMTELLPFGLTFRSQARLGPRRSRLLLDAVPGTKPTTAMMYTALSNKRMILARELARVCFTHSFPRTVRAAASKLDRKSIHEAKLQVRDQVAEVVSFLDKEKRNLAFVL